MPVTSIQPGQRWVSNTESEVGLVPDEDLRVSSIQRHFGLDPESIENLCQRVEAPGQARGLFGTSASIVLPGGIRVLEPPGPIPNSAVK